MPNQCTLIGCAASMVFQRAGAMALAATTVEQSSGIASVTVAHQCSDWPKTDYEERKAGII